MDNEKLKKYINEKLTTLKKMMGTREITTEDINLLNSLIQLSNNFSKKNEKSEDTKKDERKEEKDMYEYGARRRDSRGRYMGRRNKYGDRMPEIIGRMHDGYEDYDDWNNEYYKGNYGARERMHEPLEYMMQSVVDFVETLADDNDGDREALEIIKKYVRKIKEI